MDMSLNSFLNRVEIIFYSTLTSLLSVANRFHPQEELQADLSFLPSTARDGSGFTEVQDTPDDPFIRIWKRLSQAILPIIIWMILGFAAGFLIGMIRPR